MPTTEYSNSVINLSTEIDIAETANLQNPNETSYVSMDASNHYVSRLTNSGKLEIFDISSKNLSFNLFSSTNNPSPLKVISYDI